MKTLPALAAVTVAMALILSPMVVNAAGAITFTSPASGASYKGTASYTISGTISPAPTQADQVGITVKNPSGQTVDVASVSVSSGAFTYSTATGGSPAWVSGTYTISATDSYGATGTMTFAYTSLTIVSYNVTQSMVNIHLNLTTIQNQLKCLKMSEGVEQTDMKANFTAISNSLTSLSTQLTNLSNSVSGMSSTITSMSQTINSLSTAVTAAQNAATAAETAANNANSSVSSTQTYVLVVAVLAAITLVLELAILVRKLS